jgi:hypothetical protein
MVNLKYYLCVYQEEVSKIMTNLRIACFFPGFELGTVCEVSRVTAVVTCLVSFVAHM